MKYVIKNQQGMESGVLHSISQKRGYLEKHKCLAVITSSLTVGFGGSVGLEGPV